MKKWIGLVDCNNFFVSCERLFRPDLQGKPVIVLSSNDGCVVARSQEVKDIGVLMGVPYFKIKDIVEKHRITTFSSHFTLYRDISRRVMLVLRRELEEVEQYSVDEAFFTTDTEDLEQLAWHLKMTVEKEVGIPVSVGLAATKTQAKYANETAKKGDGVMVLESGEWLKKAPDIALSSLWGVGGRLEMRYKAHGLMSVADFLAADPSRIDQLFGINGLRLQQELAGQPVFRVGDKTEPQQSIMNSRSFAKEVFDKTVLADAVAYHLRHALADLRSMQQLATVLRVVIRPSRHGDFALRGGSKEAILSAPTDDTLALQKVARELIDEIYELDVPYKKAGIILGGLVPKGYQKNGLFPDSKPAETAKLMSIVDALNKKGDREVVLLGSHLRQRAWEVKAESCSPAYTTRWSDLATVKA